MDASSDIAMPLDSNASVDGRVRKATQRTYAVSKLCALGAAAQIADRGEERRAIDHVTIQEVHEVVTAGLLVYSQTCT